MSLRFASVSSSSKQGWGYSCHHDKRAGSWEREEDAPLQPCTGKTWLRVGLWGPRLYSSSRTGGQGFLPAPGPIVSQCGFGAGTGIHPHSPLGTQRPQISPCSSQLHWMVWLQWCDFLMSGSGSKHLLMLLGHGLALFGYGLSPFAMAQCGLQEELRIPISFCPPAFSLLLHLHMSLPPLSTTQPMCPHLAPKITPGRGQLFRAAPLC